MKKLLFGGILALAAIGLISAQESGEGLKISGSVKTGLRFDAVGGGEDWEGPAKDSDTGHPKAGNEFWAPSLSLWHDDAGNRLTLIAEYNKQNYGLKFNTELDVNKFGDWVPDLKFINVYGWFDILNGMLRFTTGKIDDGVWSAPGAEDWDYGKGVGLRFEAKPMEGLNVGLFIRPAEEYSAYWNGALSLGGNNSFIHPYAKSALSSRFTDALLETSLGAKFESDMFVVAAGLKLASEATGPKNIDWDFGMGAFSTGDRPGGIALTPPKDAYDDVKGVGFAFYIGFGLKMVDNLTAEIGLELANLGALDKYGYLWLTQKIAYDMNPMSFGLTGHQKILTAEKDKNTFYSNKDGDPANAYLEFMPWFGYALNPKTDLVLEVPVKFQPGVVDIDLGIRPKVTYKFADNFNLSAYYQFNVTAFNEDAGAQMGMGLNKDPFIRNAIQLNLEWSF